MWFALIIKTAFSLNVNVKQETGTGAYVNNMDLIYYYYMGEENVIDTQKLIIKGDHNVYNAMASVISAKIFGIEKEYIKKDGTIFPIEIHSFLIKNDEGENEGIWAIVRDINR